MRFVLLCAMLVAGQPPGEELPPPEGIADVVPRPPLNLMRLSVGGEIGPTFGGWGLWRPGTLAPGVPFAHRSHLFPIPVAEYDRDIKYDYSLAARVLVGYAFERLPVSVTGSWETYHRSAETLLLGFDPDVARQLDGLNQYNRKVRAPNGSGGNTDVFGNALGDVFGTNSTGSDEPTGDHRTFPRLQMRRVPHSEGHNLRSRVTGNVADVSLAYRVWSAREANGVEYRLLAGGRFGGFFADDVATGYGYEQSASNWFAGFGPHGGLRVDYRLGKREASDPVEFRVWGDAKGGALYGRITQRFRELDPLLPAAPYRELVRRADRTVPFLSTELGFGLFGERGGWISVGVRYSRYWGVGSVGPSALDFAAVAGFLSLGVGF